MATAAPEAPREGILERTIERIPLLGSVIRFLKRNYGKLLLLAGGLAVARSAGAFQGDWGRVGNVARDTLDASGRVSRDFYGWMGETGARGIGYLGNEARRFIHHWNIPNFGLVNPPAPDTMPPAAP